MTHVNMNAPVRMTWGEVLERSLWTALESGLAVLGTDSFLINIPDSAMLYVVGFSTGIAFVKNVARQRLTQLG